MTLGHNPVRPIAAVVTALGALALVSCGGGGNETQTAEAPAAEDGSTAAITGSGPALWLTGDDDTTIYLFGTVHVLPDDLEWRTPLIDEAMAEASVVYFETDIDPNPIEITRIVSNLGLYPPGEKLSDRLTPEQTAMLAAACDELGVSFAVVDSMKPWMGALTLAERVIVEAGYNPQSGVERTLSPIAKNSGAEIRRLETIEEQLRVFADLPEETQIRYLMEGLDEISEEPVILHELVQAWANGDVDKLVEIMISEELSGTPEIYEALLVNRNRNWVDALAALTNEETGTFFVAVGAAHLAGDDSVMAMLEERGIATTRVE